MALEDSLQKLIEQGKEIDEKTEQDKFEEWKRIVVRLLDASFPKAIRMRSKEGHSFMRVTTVQEGITLLESFMGRVSSPGQAGTIINVTQSQTTSIQNHISLQILLNIDNSKELSPEQKQEAKALYQQVETEVQKEKPNWDKVIGWLKSSLDYGLKIAPDIIKLAEVYYKAKV